MSLESVASELRRLTNVVEELAPGHPASSVCPLQTGDLRALMQARRLRDKFFGNALFGDPAWDMIVDLMIARLEGKRVSISSLCIAASVPSSTALRWISRLTERGFFLKRHDLADGRRIFIELSDEAAATFVAWASAVLAKQRATK